MILFIGLTFVFALPQALAAAPMTYSEALEQALTAMQAGRSTAAAGFLKAALTLNRNEPLGQTALGALYLRTGSPGRAHDAFAYAQQLSLREPLAGYGAALAALAQGARDAERFDRLDREAIPGAASAAAYVRLMGGDARLLRPAATDLLGQQVAAFAAMRSGDRDGGAVRLRRFLGDPRMHRLAEEPGLTFSFEQRNLAETDASPLASAIGFASTAKDAVAGQVTLSPGPLPADVSYVCYSVPGVDFTASTNHAPFTAQWNTARYPNGLYGVEVSAFSAAGQIIKQTQRTIRLQNSDAPRRETLGARESAFVRARLLALLTPHPSRKAAHFALAEYAARRGDTDGALREIEAVVAIDPLFHNARDSLRRYHMAVEGPRPGVWRVSTEAKKVALTFDDGPNPDPRKTPALLD